ncbi:MAG: hypothetical protein GXY47_06330 [Acidobacteria bacterium]|nr:hypothetical protein [Acidobacteriota bacterium]
MSKAVKKSTISAVRAEPKNRPIITLTARATDRFPFADPNPVPHLERISDDIGHMAEYLDCLYDLSALDEDNPVVAGLSLFMREIINRLKEHAELLSDIGDTLAVKGGAA